MRRSGPVAMWSSASPAELAVSASKTIYLDIATGKSRPGRSTVARPLACQAQSRGRPPRAATHIHAPRWVSQNVVAGVGLVRQRAALGRDGPESAGLVVLERGDELVPGV